MVKIRQNSSTKTILTTVIIKQIFLKEQIEFLTHKPSRSSEQYLRKLQSKYEGGPIST